MLALSALTSAPTPAHAAKVAGVTLPDEITLDGETLALRGAGVRKRLFLKLYVAALYGGEDGADGPRLAALDAPMMIHLVVRSDLVTREKMVEALEEGFEKSTGGDTAAVREGIDTLLAAMPADIGEGQRYDLVYRPGSGTTLSRRGSVLATIEGLAFKEALFGIWLSDDPVQADLKAAMVGG